MTIEIKAEKRARLGKLESLRKDGFLPAVFYGHKKESTPIQIKKNEFLKAWKQAGESTVVTLAIPEGDIEALIHDVDLDPVTSEPRHADFYVFEKGHKVEIGVPLEFIGVSPAVKDFGGVIMKVLHEIKIKAEPSKLPHAIEVDISTLLEIGHQISASDLKLPAGVELIENPEEMVVNVVAPKEEKEEEVAPVDLSQIEVEKKGKKDEEGAPEGEEASSKY
jgi:large subunit ribosomal protein L25